MEAWREVLRNCVLPAVSRPFFRHPRSALRSLRRQLAESSPRLIADAATEPLEWVHCGRALCVAACPLAYLVWFDRELDTVAEVDRAYRAFLVRIAQRAPWKTSVDDLVTWIESQRWETVRRELGREIDLVLWRIPDGPADEF